MMKKKKRNTSIGLLALVSALTVLPGCEKQEEIPWEPSHAAAVSVAGDGTVTEYLSDPLDADWYHFTELKQMLEEEAASYHKDHGPDRIRIDAAEEMENGSVSLILSYQSWEDYAAFHRVPFYAGTMIGAQMEGYSFDAAFVQVRKGKLMGGEHSAADVLSLMDDRVVIVREPAEIHVDGTIDYVSSGCQVLSADTAYAQDAEQPVYVIYDD